MRVHKLAMVVFLLLGALNVQAADLPSKSVDLISTSPGSELWHQVRQRVGEASGTTMVRAEALADVSGQSRREYRMQQLIPITSTEPTAQLKAGIEINANREPTGITRAPSLTGSHFIVLDQFRRQLVLPGKFHDLSSFNQ